MQLLVTVIGADRVAQKLRDMPSRIREALFKAVQQQWLGLQGYIVQSKLSGQVLHRVTGNLASSINAGGANSLSTLVESGDAIIGTVGTKVRYARLHEYGATVNVPAYNRTSKLGKSYTVRSHKATYPERSFLRSGIRDRADQIRNNIAVAMRKAVREVNAG